jgi:hypothetical protein
MSQHQQRTVRITIQLLLGTCVILALLYGGYLLYATHRETDRATTVATYKGALFAQSETPLFPELQAYQEATQRALAATPPLLQLLSLGEREQRILGIALRYEAFTTFFHDATSNTPTRNELFALRTARYNEIKEQASYCQSDACFIVEIYNFTHNITSQAIVHEARQQVLHVRHLRNFQPEIPPHLQRLAELLAVNTPEVITEAQQRLSVQDLVMSGTKTSLRNSSCERSNHLCVAPTFIKGQQALWTIVDLTDARVVGTRWSSWDRPQSDIVTEGRLRDFTIHEALCQKPQHHTSGKWRFAMSLTSSDGLAFEEIYFQDKRVLESYKNVDWHVSYSDTDGFGYSDAIGCPLFSAAAVVPAEFGKFKPVALPHGIQGVEYHQDFLSKQWPLPCNYYYEQRLQLFDDASLRLALASVGRGCGDNGTYRPVMRFVLADAPRKISVWRDGAWHLWDREGWALQPQELSPEGYWLKIETGDSSGWYLEPARGQFGDKGRGDNAYLYITALDRSRDEGASDLPTIGPCCNNDHRQGPEKFISTPPESVADTQVAFWYVPQLKNDARPGEEYCWGSSHIENGVVVKEEYPCIAGPRLVPFS